MIHKGQRGYRGLGIAAFLVPCVLFALLGPRLLPRAKGRIHSPESKTQEQPHECGPGLVDGSAGPWAKRLEFGGHLDGDATGAGDPSGLAIFGTVCSSAGPAIGNAAIELVFAEGDISLPARSGIDGTFRIEVPEESLHQDSPVEIRVKADGYVATSRSLWSERSGFAISEHERAIEILLDEAQDLKLFCRFEDGSPIAAAILTLRATVGLSTWFVADEPPIAATHTDQDGVGILSGMPLRGVYRVVLGLPQLPSWFETVIDLRPGEPRTITAAHPCTLTVIPEQSCFQASPSGLAPTAVQLLTEVGGLGSYKQGVLKARLDQGSCSLRGLHLGQVVELRLLYGDECYAPLASGHLVRAITEELHLDCAPRSFVTEERAARVQDPAVLTWRLVDTRGRPFTNERIGALDLSGFLGEWHSGARSGNFGLQRQDHAPTAEIQGTVTLPLELPATLTIDGYGGRQNWVLRAPQQLIGVCFDPAVLGSESARVAFDGVSNGERIAVAFLEITSRSSGLSYQLLREQRDPARLLEVRLPPGSYDFRATSAERGVSLGRFDVADSEDRTIMAEFRGSGSLRGQIDFAEELREILLVTCGAGGPASSGCYSALPILDGSFSFWGVVPGEYELLCRTDGHNGSRIRPAGSVLVRDGVVTDLGIRTLSSSGVDTASMGLQMRGDQRAFVDIGTTRERLFRGWLDAEDMVEVPRSATPRVEVLQVGDRRLGGMKCSCFTEGDRMVFVIPETR